MYMIETTELWRMRAYKNKTSLIGKLVFGNYATDWVINPDHNVHSEFVFGRIKEVEEDTFFSTDPWLLVDHPSGCIPNISAIVLDNGTRIRFGYGNITEDLMVEI